MKFLGLALFICVSAFAGSLSSNHSNSAYRRYDDVVVNIWNANAWKILSVSPDQILRNKSDWRTGGNNACANILGDGWHTPSESDWKADFDEISKSGLSKALGGEKFWLSNSEMSYGKATYYRAGNFSSKQTVRVKADKKSILPTVCVCGPRVSQVDLRRTKSRCAGFREDTQTRPEYVDPEMSQKGTLGVAMKTCASKGLRVPSYAEVNSITDDRELRKTSPGCVWSSTISKETSETRYQIHVFEKKYGVLGKGNAMPYYDGCNIVCVL